MIIEQIRYFVPEDRCDAVVSTRREIDRIRSAVNVPPGHILLADETPSGAPTVVWQCAYEDEGEMGLADARLIGNVDYEAARERLAQLVDRVELELYTSDDGE
jgi:hypothetical protein